MIDDRFAITVLLWIPAFAGMTNWGDRFFLGDMFMEGIDRERRFVELRGRGVSYRNIGEEFGVAKTTLIRWSKRFEIEINNVREIEMEGLREEFLICREQRMRLLGTQLGKVIEELMRRDMGDVPTYRLYEIQSQLLRELKHETDKITFMREKPTGSIKAMQERLKKTECWEG